MKISLLSRDEIDRSKWNSCVHYANNGNVFGYKWYLDAISKDWEALVEEGYGSVFPLIWKKNWLGSKKICLPELIPEGGIYSEGILSSGRIRHFIEAIPKKYRSFTISLSGQAKIPKDLGLQIEKQANTQLSLNQSYEGLKNGFSPEFSDKLVDAETLKLQPVSNLKPEVVADFYRKNSLYYNKKNYFAYLRIMYNCLHRGWGFSTGITDAKGNLLAVSFFIYSHGKIVNFLPVVSATGQKAGAMPLLLNLVLQTHSGKPVILDFNGFPDQGIGAQEQFYYHISR